jgi:hypothetical protein
MVVSSLKIAWHVPPMPGDRFNQEMLVLDGYHWQKLIENNRYKTRKQAYSK